MPRGGALDGFAQLTEIKTQLSKRNLTTASREQARDSECPSRTSARLEHGGEIPTMRDEREMPAELLAIRCVLKAHKQGQPTIRQIIKAGAERADFESRMGNANQADER
jgi:hypothetical protein